MKKICCWVKEAAQPGKAAVYCGKPVGYKMIPMGGEPGAPKVRQYETFCPTHKKLAEEQEFDWDE